MVGRTKSKSRRSRSRRRSRNRSRSKALASSKPNALLVNAAVAIDQKGVYARREAIIKAVGFVSGTAASLYVASHPNIINRIIVEYNRSLMSHTLSVGITITYLLMAKILAYAIRTVLSRVFLPRKEIQFRWAFGVSKMSKSRSRSTKRTSHTRRPRSRSRS